MRIGIINSERRWRRRPTRSQVTIGSVSYSRTGKNSGLHTSNFESDTSTSYPLPRYLGTTSTPYRYPFAIPEDFSAASDNHQMRHTHLAPALSAETRRSFHLSLATRESRRRLAGSFSGCGKVLACSERICTLYAFMTIFILLE